MMKIMKTEEIMALLRKGEHIWDGKTPIPYVWSGRKAVVLELDKDQDKLYNAILKTIPKDALQEELDVLFRDENTSRKLFEKIEWFSGNHSARQKKNPARNELISTLVALYLNKKSKKVVYARKQLRERYDKQSYQDQSKILRAFLAGVKNDREWAGRRLRDDWRKEMTAAVKEAWSKNADKILSYVILRHFPDSFILAEQERLGEVAGYQFVCARVGNDPSFILDETRLRFPDYLYVMARLGRKVDAVEMERRIYDFLLHYNAYNEIKPMYPPMFSEIPGWDRMVWAMGVFGMQDELVRLLEYENRVKEHLSILSWKKEPEGSDIYPGETEEILLQYDEWPCFMATVRHAIAPESDFDALIKRESIEYMEKTGSVFLSQTKEPFKTDSAWVEGMDIDEEDDPKDAPEEKEWYYREEQERKPFMTVEEEWTLYVDCFYDHRPRLQGMLKDAVITEHDQFTEIAIPVENEFQEGWLTYGPWPLARIRRDFEEHSYNSSTSFDIIIKRTDN